jgi:hypothetical protein
VFKRLRNVDPMEKVGLGGTVSSSDDPAPLPREDGPPVVFVNNAGTGGIDVESLDPGLGEPVLEVATLLPPLL